MSGDGTEAARAEYLARVRARLVARRDGVDPVPPPSRVAGPTLTLTPAVVPRDPKPENVPAEPVPPLPPVRQPSPYSETDRPLSELAAVARTLSGESLEVLVLVGRRLARAEERSP